MKSLSTLLTLLTLLILLMVIILIILYIKYTCNLKNKLKVINELNKRKERKNIAIVTLETRESEMLFIHNKNIEEYCKIHGYTYIFTNSYENKLKLPIYWKKIQLVKEILENNNFDYVLWLDSDTLIIDKSIPLEVILEEDKSIYMGKDMNSELNLNAGVFIIKNNRIGLSFLNECIELYINRDKCKDEFGNYSLNGKWSGECYEQGIMNELIKNKYFNKFKLFDDHIVLNTNTPNTTCFILHLFGGTEKHKELKRNMAFNYIIDDNTYFDDRMSQLLFLIEYWGKVVLN